jgi:hypothetical protein
LHLGNGRFARAGSISGLLPMKKGKEWPDTYPLKCGNLYRIIDCFMHEI